MEAGRVKKRLLLIGLDAGDADLIDRWSEAGVLPNIAAIKSQGAWTRMSTTAEIFHVSAWPSIFTGTAPETHGLYHAYVTRPGHQGLLRPRPDQSPVPFVWKLLNDHGHRSVIVDAFLTCPLQDFNGVQIVDWGSWSWFWDPTMLPASLKGEIRKRFGPYPAEDHSRVGITPPSDLAGFRDRLLAAVAQKTKVMKWLLHKEEWDFFLVVFGESHPAGHYFWHLHDPDYLTYPRNGDRALGHALRDVYVALDGAVGELQRSVGSNTTVMLVSGDGMGPNYSGSHLLIDVLTRIGALNHPAANGGERVAGNSESGSRGDLLKTIRNVIPQRVRIAVSDALLSRQMKEQLSLRWKTAGIAWPRTKAFVIENANEGFIRINLKGREPEGSVAAGVEYEAICAEICRTARTMVNPQTGKPAASAVYNIPESFRGPRVSHMPDIVIIWNTDAKITTQLLIEKHGLVRAQAASCEMAPFYTGNHRPNAFAAVVGPDLPRDVRMDGRSILDVAPTILAAFAIDKPDYMEGTAFSEMRRPTDVGPSR